MTRYSLVCSFYDDEDCRIDAGDNRDEVYASVLSAICAAIEGHCLLSDIAVYDGGEFITHFPICELQYLAWKYSLMEFVNACFEEENDSGEPSVNKSLKI